MRNKQTLSRAFSLMEVVMSIAILSIIIPILTGLIMSGLKTVDASAEETEAVHIIEAIINDFKTTPDNDSTTLLFNLPNIRTQSVSRGSFQLYVDVCMQVHHTKTWPDVRAYDVNCEYVKRVPENPYCPLELSFVVKWNPDKVQGGVKKDEVTEVVMSGAIETLVDKR